MEARSCSILAWPSSWKSLPPDDLRTFGPVENTASMERSAIVGTISYMSPEQAEGQEVDARSDVFSFGAVLYEMVTGNQPFRGESTLATLARILQTDPTPVEEIAPGVPRQLGRLIMRCLRKDKANRWQSIADVRGTRWKRSNRT